MSYKFEYKTAKPLTLCEFTEELARVCSKWFIEEHQPIVLKKAPKLYEDKALVYVVYQSYCYRDAVAYYERRRDSYESEGKECPKYITENLDETKHGLHVMGSLIADMLS